jgi:hypothetical protein
MDTDIVKLPHWEDVGVFAFRGRGAKHQPHEGVPNLAMSFQHDHAMTVVAV